MDNKIEIICEDDYCVYRCSNGRSFIFDTDDLEFFKHHHCTVNERGYVTTNRKKDLITHLLLEVGNDCVVDHINGNPFDNHCPQLKGIDKQWLFKVLSRKIAAYLKRYILAEF